MRALFDGVFVMRKLGIYYDLRVSPITFDSAVFLATAVGAGRLAGFSRFDVHIIANAFRNVTPRERSYDLAQRNWRLNNIIIRLARMLQDVDSVGVWQGAEVYLTPFKYPENYDPNNPVAASYGFPGLIAVNKAGGDVQPFRSSDYAKAWAKTRLGSDEALVMAVRSGDFNQNRDANLAQWFKLYEYLTQKGHKVVVVPDQFDVLYQRSAWEYEWDLVPEAAIDLDLRLALYQSCRANVAWTGGHTALMWLSKSRFIIFGSWNQSNFVSTREWYASQGVPVGAQPPFLIKDQQVFDWLEASSVSTDYLISESEKFLQ
jgi:hypothetical protein